jgi:hypothetical protein
MVLTTSNKSAMWNIRDDLLETADRMSDWQTIVNRLNFNLQLRRGSEILGINLRKSEKLRCQTDKR